MVKKKLIESKIKTNILKNEIKSLKDQKLV